MSVLDGLGYLASKRSAEAGSLLRPLEYCGMANRLPIRMKPFVEALALAGELGVVWCLTL